MENTKNTKYDFIHRDSMVNVPMSPVFVQNIYPIINYLIGQMGVEKFLDFSKRHIENGEKPSTELEMYISTLSALTAVFDICAKEQGFSHEVDEKDLKNLTDEEKNKFFDDVIKKTNEN